MSMMSVSLKRFLRKSLQQFCADERFHVVVDALLNEIERRFEALKPGTVSRDQQGWPSTWYWETDDRADFLKAVQSIAFPRTMRLCSVIC